MDKKRGCPQGYIENDNGKCERIGDLIPKAKSWNKHRKTIFKVGDPLWYAVYPETINAPAIATKKGAMAVGKWREKLEKGGISLTADWEFLFDVKRRKERTEDVKLIHSHVNRWG